MAGGDKTSRPETSPAPKTARASAGSAGGLYGGGLYGAGLGGLYGGMYGLGLGGLGLYGGMLGLSSLSLLGGGVGGLSSLMSPFSLANLFYPVSSGGDLSFQIPYLQMAPLLGVAGLYNQLFPYLLNPSLAQSGATTTTTI